MATQPLTPEQRKQRIETIVKILSVAGLCLILGPVYLTMLHGMEALVALGVFSAIGFVVINLIPAFARLVGNWRLKALKAVAAANPIENLEMIYRDKMNALAASRENINATYAILQDLYNQIKEHDANYPGKPSQWLDKYNKLKALVELRGEKYKASKVKLQEFSDIIDEKRSDWKIAQTMAQANKLANVGEDFESKLMQDTALTTVQDGLNLAFAELDTALLDEAPTSATVVAAPAAPKAIAQTSSACSVSMPKLDLEEPITIDAGPVPVKTSRRNS
jgi:hypothetical protein